MLIYKCESSSSYVNCSSSRQIPNAAGIAGTCLYSHACSAAQLSAIVCVDGTNPSLGGNKINAVLRCGRLVFYQHSFANSQHYAINGLHARECDIRNGGSAHALFCVELLQLALHIGLRCDPVRGELARVELIDLLLQEGGTVGQPFRLGVGNAIGAAKHWISGFNLVDASIKAGGLWYVCHYAVP